MTVLSPNGGETWHVGETIRIRWRMDVAGQAVLLYISPNDGEDWYVINADHSVFTGDTNWADYGWTIPAAMNSVSLVATTCRVRVSEYLQTTVTDASDSAFTIEAAATVRASAPLRRRAEPAGGQVLFDLSGRQVPPPAGRARSWTSHLRLLLRQAHE